MAARNPEHDKFEPTKGNTDAPAESLRQPLPWGAAIERLPSIDGLIEVLPWDFRTSFPILLNDSRDAREDHQLETPEGKQKSRHEKFIGGALKILSQLDRLMQGVERSSKPSKSEPVGTHSRIMPSRDQFAEESKRLNDSFGALINAYERYYGAEAKDALLRAIRAWRAGIEVISRQTFADPQSQSQISEAAPARRRHEILPSSAQGQPRSSPTSATVYQCALRQARRLVEGRLGHRLPRFQLVRESQAGNIGTEFYSYCRHCDRPCFVFFPISDSVVDGIRRTANHRGFEITFIISGTAAFRTCASQ